MPLKECLFNQRGKNPRCFKESKKQLPQNPCLCTMDKNVINNLFFSMAKRTSICQKKTPSSGPNPKLKLSPMLPPKQKKPPYMIDVACFLQTNWARDSYEILGPRKINLGIQFGQQECPCGKELCGYLLSLFRRLRPLKAYSPVEQALSRVFFIFYTQKPRSCDEVAEKLAKKGA